jgi:DNA-binding GntR family transcriptional regulator
MTLDEVREIYEVRESLEGFAARQAALRASDAQRRKLVQMIKRRSLNPMGLDDRQVLVFNNDLFHRTIFRASGNGRLLREIVRTSEYYFNIRVASLYSDDEMAASARQHSELVQSIMARDGDRAEQTMRLHVREALAAIMRHSV